MKEEEDWRAIDDGSSTPHSLRPPPNKKLFLLASKQQGRDKFENESLIAHALPHDIWFHVEDMSSAHVYLRPPSSLHPPVVASSKPAKGRGGGEKGRGEGCGAGRGRGERGEELRQAPELRGDDDAGGGRGQVRVRGGVRGGLYVKLF